MSVSRGQVFSSNSGLSRELRDIRRLYDETSFGVVKIDGSLDPSFHTSLRTEILAVYGKGGNRDCYRLEDVLSEQRSELSEKLPICMLLAESYTQFVYNPIGKIVGFPSISRVNSITICRYDGLDSKYKFHGFDYHRDAPSYGNLIGIVSVEGSAVFTVGCEDRESGRDVDLSSFAVYPGTLTLMRGARLGIDDDKGQSFRPLHKAKVSGKEDRYFVVFRQDVSR
ncbi:MAG TPA: hypothetical protein VL945_02250 [Candidatus Saccharimonadales bacterium]|nr:hypothetical protein [Candidatus Saccharimonadales bacterium]